MIAALRGKVAEKHAGRVILDVAGVGYEVSIPVETYSRIGEPGEELSLHVHTHTRENVLALYGFHSRRDKALFEKFINVSGVGPRLALTLLSGLSTGELLRAIRDADSKTLIRIPGVGKKTGQRIILELQDKIAEFADGDDAESSSGAAVVEDVISVLVNLGLSQSAADRAVRAARRKGAPAEFDPLFRQAMESVKR